MGGNDDDNDDSDGGGDSDDDDDDDDDGGDSQQGELGNLTRKYVDSMIKCKIDSILIFFLGLSLWTSRCTMPI